jgi:hypothetical protein
MFGLSSLADSPTMDDNLPIGFPHNPVPREIALALVESDTEHSQLLRPTSVVVMQWKPTLAKSLGGQLCSLVHSQAINAMKRG